MKKILTTFFTIHFSLFTIHLFAQTPDTLRSEIPEVIISATRTQKTPDQTPRSVTVITASDAQKLQPNDLAQMLSQQEGISIIGSGQNPGMTETIFMRGTNSNHTLMMIDGVRISDPSTVNDALDLTEIPASGFDKIEIVRGSHSTLYGSSGIGGVINLISAGKQSPGLHGNVNVRGGTFGKSTSLLEEKLHLNYSFKSGMYANLDFFNTNINGLDATVDTIKNADAFKSYDKDDHNLLKAGAKLGYQTEKWNAFISYAYTDQQTDFDKSGWKYNNAFGENPNAFYDGDKTEIGVNRNLFAYNIEHTFSNFFSLKLNGGYTSLKRLVIDDSSIINTIGTYDHTFNDATYEGSNLNTDLQVTINFKNITLIAGAGVLRETMTYDYHYFTNGFFGPYEINVNLDSLDLNFNLYNAFAQADVSGKIISEKFSALNLILGTRYNHHDLFGDHIDYEINPSFNFGSNALIYASFSSGFNAPSLYQMYSPEVYYTSAITRGNPDLKPENSRSIEFGFKQKVNSHFKYSLALYQNKIENEIEYVYLWDKNVPIEELGSNYYQDDFRGDTYLNVGTLTSRGVEISFSSSFFKHFSLGGNLNLVEGNLEYNPADIDTTHTEGNHIQLYSNGNFLTEQVETKGLVRRPSTANVFFSYQPIKNISLQLNTRWIGKHTDIFYDYNLGPYGALNTVELNDYVLFDFIGSYEFKKHYSATVRVENILNSSYTETRGFTSRGRGVYVSLRAAF